MASSTWLWMHSVLNAVKVQTVFEHIKVAVFHFSCARCWRKGVVCVQALSNGRLHVIPTLLWFLSDMVLGLFFPFRFNIQVDCIFIQACCCQRCCQNMSAKVHFPVVVPLLHYWRIQGNLTYTQPCKHTQTLELTLEHERYISFHFDLFYRLMIVKQKCVPIAE